jgi:methylated-DNA-[protein]-cysteine S-methyltransferase
MSAQGFALFDTAIGACAVAWRTRRIVGLQLPEASEDGTRTRMLARFPQAQQTQPPPHVQRVIDAIAALLRGQPRDLSGVALDMDDVPAFHRRVYEEARRIPAGMTLCYGELAFRLGRPGAARAVGQALGRNPFPIVVPCHRIVSSGGKLSGFSAYGGTATKAKLLSIERGCGPCA